MGGQLALEGTVGPRAASPGGTADPRARCPGGQLTLGLGVRGTADPRARCPGGQFKRGTSHPTTPAHRVQAQTLIWKCR